MKTKTETAKIAAEGLKNLNQPKQTTALTVVPKKMSVTEKLDSLMQLEALSSKHEYLTEVQTNLESFGSGKDGFGGAKITLSCNYKDVKVSNPSIIEEVTKLLRQRVKEAKVLAEKEILDFQII